MTLAISSGLIAAIVALIAVDIFAIAFGLSFRRAQKAHQAAGAAPLPPAPSKPAPSVSRRDFFRGSLLVSLMVFGAQFGGATLAFLWPNLKGGFGSLINAGSLKDIKSQLQDTQQPVYFGAGRFYIVPYTGSPTPDADYESLGVTSQGVMPLYQRCVHLGCRVPFCTSSKWFECPCHGSKYSEAGEYKLGPAPRGMDRFKITINGDAVTVDTSEIILGPPRGTNTTNQNAQGPFCVAPG
ncbi:MAG: Rieske 2Fe-2S domain-containing protein [Actinomycetota bacterium]|nr:Rieske 2Fe-2S domain-containing protein [Actinomycetota bacterium]